MTQLCSNCKMIIKSSSSAPSEDVPQCSICLDTISDRTTAHDCGHQFCYECIRRWTRTHHRCPVCREPIVLIRRMVASDELITSREFITGSITEYDRIVQVRTPINDSLCIVKPIVTKAWWTGRVSADSIAARGYRIVTLQRNRLFIIAKSAIPPCTLFVTGQAVDLVTAALRSLGIGPIEQCHDSDRADQDGDDSDDEADEEDQRHYSFLRLHQSHSGNNDETHNNSNTEL